MAEPATTTIGLAALGTFLWNLAGNVAVEVTGGEAHDKYRSLTERLGQRLVAGDLPANEHILRAVHRSLSGAALVFAHNVHDPQRKLLGALLRNPSWPNLHRLGHQLAECISGNIIPETPSDKWLAALIEQASDPTHFQDFDVTLVLADSGASLVRPHVDARLREHLHREFLRWLPVGRGAISPTPDKPSDFDACVNVGLTLPRGGTLTFYDVFRFFYREELKTNEEVHRAYVVNLLSEVKSDVDAMREALPSSSERQRFAAAVSGLAGFEEFGCRLDRQGHQLLEEVRGGFAALEHKLDYAIAGLRIERFLSPDPPTRELDLLKAKHRAATLVGRDTDLEALCSWVGSGVPIPVRLLVGEAGTGKTRLAFELLLRINAELPHWQAGIVSTSALRKFDATKEPGDWAWAAPTLMVVDYAQPLVGPLSELLVSLTGRRNSGLPPLRILLLERRPGEWFDELLREESPGGPCAVGALFEPPAPVTLTPLPEGELRRHLFLTTLTRARAFPIVPKPATIHTDEVILSNVTALEASLARAHFAAPLYVQCAALVAAERGVQAALAMERVDLGLAIAEKEIRRLKRFARVPYSRAQERAMAHLAACATLERGLTQSKLRAAVNEEMSAAGLVWPDGARDLEQRLREALPGDELPVAHVEPDFVGEALVLKVLLEEGHSTRRPNEWVDWSSTVVRCFLRDPFFTASTLLHSFENYAHDGRYSEPLLAAVDALIAHGTTGNVGLLVAIERALPERTLTLRKRAAEVTQRLYDRVKDASHEAGSASSEVARLANNLANRLSEVGRREDALGPAEEAVRMNRALAERSLDGFFPNLAASLHNLATRLHEVGRREDALGPAEEAVGMYRVLVERRPDSVLPNLAMSLNNLAIQLSEVGRREDALGPGEEAVRIYRTLAERSPDAFLPDLAMSLNNLAIRLSEVGRREDALGPAEDAVRMYRALAAGSPDAFLPSLGASVNNLALRLSDVGRHEDALGPAEEAVRIRSALAERSPDAFLPDLAMSLNNLAIRLSRIGRREDALRPAEEAARMYRTLAERSSDAVLPNLAMSLNNLAARLSEAGRREDALAPAEEAVRIHRALRERSPGAFLPDLAMSLNNLSTRLSEAGRREDALASADEAVRMYRVLADRSPDAFLPNLAVSLQNLAMRLSEVGRREDSLGRAEEAVRISRALAERSPDAFLPNFAMSLNNLATRLSELGRREDALGPAEETVRMYRALAERSPDAFLPSLAASLNNLAIRLSEVGHPEDALGPAEEAVRIRSTLAECCPDASSQSRHVGERLGDAAE